MKAKLITLSLITAISLAFTGCKPGEAIEKYAEHLYQAAPEGRDNAVFYERDTGLFGYQTNLSIEGMYKEDGVLYAESYLIKLPFGYRHGKTLAIRVDEQ